jgi:hypothetical protein
MIAAETWRRFTDHWGAMGLAGLYTALTGLLAGIVFWIVMLPVALTTGFGAARLIAGGITAGALGVLMGAGMLVLLGLLVAAVAALAVAPLVTGGLIHAVVQVQRDQPATFGDLWNAGVRHWGRLFRLNLILLAIWVGLLVVGAILSLVPFLGPLVWGLGSGMVMIVLGGYGPYMAVTEQLGARETVAKAFRILSVKFTDVLLTLLVLAGSGIVLGLVFYILSRIPFLGRLAILVIDVFLGPLYLLYLATRYRTNIAPDFGPPGGDGTWYQGPPTGQ